MKTTFETIGAEVEEQVVSSESVKQQLKDAGISDYVNLTTDASVESIVNVLTSKVKVFDPDSALQGLGLDTTKVGLELVTTPLKFETFEYVMTRLLLGLAKVGELPKSKRESIHIHVGAPNHISFLKKAVLFGVKFESLFYRLGGMGYTFRGLSNQAIYCRPLSSYGPPVARSDDGSVVQVLELSQLLEAEDTVDFWTKFGVDPNTTPGNGNKYHPCRYLGFNIFSILLHGTLEFRHFNSSLDFQAVNSVARLCQVSTELINRVPIMELGSIPDHSVFRERDDMDILYTLLKLVRAYNQDYTISSEQESHLRRLVETTRPVVLAEGYVKTHLWDKFKFNSNIPRRSIHDKLQDSGFVDIHNFKPSMVNLVEMMEKL